MPQIRNDGKKLTLCFDDETFALAGAAELGDTYVLLTQTGSVFEVVADYLPPAGETMNLGIFDILVANTPNGAAVETPRFIPVVFETAPEVAPVEETPVEEAAAPEPEPEIPADPEPEPAPEEIPAEPEPETVQEDTTEPEPEPAPEEIPAEEETQPEADEIPADPEPEQEVTPEPEIEETPTDEEPAERIEDKMKRGEPINLSDLAAEIAADKAAGRYQEPKKGRKPRKGKNASA